MSNKGTGCAIICVGSYSRRHSREQYAALIAHEATHVVQDMRERLGEMGPEGEAYMVQQIVQECLQIAWASSKVSRKQPSA